MAETKKEVKRFLLPEARVINHSLFVKDAYKGEQGKPGTPAYRVELAFDPADVTGEGTIEDDLCFAAMDKWGDTVEAEFNSGKVVTPLLDGNSLAERRVAKNKPGDAYKGKIVIRASTIYNFNGEDAAGGVQVFGPDVKPISAVDKDGVYQGCYGQALVTIGVYTGNRGEKGVKFYLSAFQKTRDGERLVTPQNHSVAFKPVGRPAGAATPAGDGRRSRKG